VQAFFIHFLLTLPIQGFSMHQKLARILHAAKVQVHQRMLPSRA